MNDVTAEEKREFLRTGHKTCLDCPPDIKNKCHKTGGPCLPEQAILADIGAAEELAKLRETANAEVLAIGETVRKLSAENLGLKERIAALEAENQRLTEEVENLENAAFEASEGT